MYFNDVHIGIYVGAIILAMLVAQIVDWANKRLPEYKKVISREFFDEYKQNFKPNYILMLVWNKEYTNCKFRFNKIYDFDADGNFSIYD